MVPVSIIITTRNRKEALIRCTRSIIRSSYSSFELIIVDDASTDGTQSLSPKDFLWPHTSIIHVPTQIMMTRARNLGARSAKGNYLLFIDDDNEVPAEMVGQLVEAAESHPEYGILGPVMYYLTSRTLKMCGQRINLYTGRTRELTELPPTGIIDSDGVPNAFLIRRETFSAVGGFDEAIFQTFTEPDFAYQALKHGYRCGIVATAAIYHDIPVDGQLTPRSLGSTYIQKAYCLMRNRTVIVARYGTRLQKIVYAIFFSWFWPSVYSALMLRWGITRVLPFYWSGFIDGWRYLLGGHLVPGLPPHLQKRLNKD
ncbi:MAG: glycosyltransferase family 2 protein [Kiritimatiellia bacterium]|jgi:GT2 family glycosyltransferase